MSLEPAYQYRSSVVRIQDADSLILNVLLGFYVTLTLPFRLSGIDTAELNSRDPEKRLLAQKAKARLIELLADPQVLIRSLKPFKGDKFGRYLAEIINSQGINVNQTLLDEGLAVPYQGGKRQ